MTKILTKIKSNLLAFLFVKFKKYTKKKTFNNCCYEHFADSNMKFKKKQFVFDKSIKQ